METVSIGHQDFEQVISNHYFYVDKTDFIRQWWEYGDPVTLITRPRRFGKTLTMSMLEKFFSVSCADRGGLFEGLSVWRDERFRKLQGSYPVISLSFAGVKEVSFADARKKICQMITELFNQYYFLLDQDFLTEQERAFFRRVSPEMEDYVASLSLRTMSGFLCRLYGKKVIILLDEYDTPLQEAYMQGYLDEVIAFIRNLFNSTFKTNPYMERAIMTGITRISKDSIFSDLNNLEVVTSSSRKYADAFGFTQPEVSAALREYGMERFEPQVREWYDGFRFGDKTHIYNPWSILNFLSSGIFAAYWANTSSNGMANRLIKGGSREIKMVMEDLLQGKTFHTVLDEQIVLSQLDHRVSATWSLLLASGYLTIVAYERNPSTGLTEFDLKLTNKEVWLMFRQMVEEWFADYTSDYNDFIRALLRNDLPSMNAYMNQVALATFSFFDTGAGTSGHTEPERFYHGFVLGLIVDLADQYVITSNRESGFGRYDVMLAPRNNSRDGIIIEFKVRDAQSESSLEETAQAALRQIEARRYEETLLEEGVAKERIRMYGFAFEGKTVLIAGR